MINVLYKYIYLYSYIFLSEIFILKCIHHNASKHLSRPSIVVMATHLYVLNPDFWNGTSYLFITHFQCVLCLYSMFVLYVCFLFLHLFFGKVYPEIILVFNVCFLCWFSMLQVHRIFSSRILDILILLIGNNFDPELSIPYSRDVPGIWN